MVRWLRVNIIIYDGNILYRENPGILAYNSTVLHRVSQSCFDAAKVFYRVIIGERAEVRLVLICITYSVHGRLFNDNQTNLTSVMNGRFPQFLQTSSSSWYCHCDLCFSTGATGTLQSSQIARKMCGDTSQFFVDFLSVNVKPQHLVLFGPWDNYLSIIFLNPLI